MAKKETRTGGQILLRLAFVLYIAAMLWLLFGQRLGTEIYRQNLAESINLTPFATLRMYWKLLRNSSDPYLVRHAFINLAGNVVMFIPLGFYQPYLLPKLRSFFKTMLTTVLLILVVEVVQYVTCLGSCDIDDLLLNLLGAGVGYLLFKLRRR